MKLFDQDRIGSIDACRGFAALGVAWFHLYTQNGQRLTSDAAPHFFNVMSVWGRFGVILFFAISGFVVAFTLFPRSDMRGLRDVMLYFVRRSVRLDPTYWAVLVLYIILTPVLLKISPVDSSLFGPRTFSLTEWVRNIFYFVSSGGDFYNVVTWTLVIEVQFYLVFALFIVSINALDRKLGVDRSSAAVGFLLILLIISVLRLFDVIPALDYWVFDYIYAFLAGIIIALSVKGVPYCTPMLLALLLCSALGYFYTRDSNELALVFSAVLILAAVSLPVMRTALAREPFLWLGKLSYGVYLLHVIIGGMTIALLQYYLSNRVGIHQIGFVLVGVVATLGASAIIFRLVEAPSIRLSKRIPVAAGPKDAS